MKKVYSLLILSIFAISSCAKKPLEFTVAEERLNKINENVEFLKNYSFVVQIKNSGKENKTLTLTYETNEKDDKHFIIDVKEGNDNYHNEGFKVKHDKYGEVTYTNVFNQEENKYVISAITKKNANGELDINYEFSSMGFQFYTMLPLLYFDLFACPDPFFSLGSNDYTDEDQEEIDNTYAVEYQFYADGETDLRMESVAKLKEQSDSDETVKYAKNKALFKDFTFFEGTMHKETVGGDIEKVKANLTVKGQDFSFSLPDDWENYIA